MWRCLEDTSGESTRFIDTERAAEYASVPSRGSPNQGPKSRCKNVIGRLRVIRQGIKELNYMRARDYVSPGLELLPVHLAELFPQMRRRAPQHFRVPHYKWVDRRFAGV